MIVACCAYGQCSMPEAGIAHCLMPQAYCPEDQGPCPFSPAQAHDAETAGTAMRGDPEPGIRSRRSGATRAISAAQRSSLSAFP